MAIGEYQETTPRLFVQGLYDVSAVALQRLGTIRALDDGRVYAYAKAGGVALLAGKLNQSKVPAVADHIECVVANTAIGAKRISVTLGGSIVAAKDLYKDGYLWINKNTGVGQLLKIRGHAAIGAGGTGYFELYDALRVATASSAEASIGVHPQDGVVITPTTLTAPIAGVSPIAVPLSNYFWNQVKGPCCALVDGTWVVGGALCPSASVGGAIMPQAETTITVTVGTACQVNITAEYGMCMLDVPGY